MEEDVHGALRIRFKAEHGMPPSVFGCHTGGIGGGVIEGHVPNADIRRVLAERPDAIGLAVSGMPYGLPGMGPGTERETCGMGSIGRDGPLTVFARYPAA